MQLTGNEIIDHGGPQVIKALLMSMNGDAKAGSATFRLKGACALPARARMGSNKTSASTQWTFIGDEELSVQQVYQEADVHRDAVRIKLTFVPAPTSLGLLKDGFASMAMDLDKAFNHFEGLEDWASKHSMAAPKIVEKAEGRAKVAVPKLADFRESEQWGAW